MDSHPPFDNLELLSSPDYDVVLFKNMKRFIDPFEDVPNHDYKSPDNRSPGRKARQQNADVVSMLRHVLYHFQFEHFMFMEDDFITCDDMVSETLRVMEELIHRDSNYCALRISYGMNGIILPREHIRNFIYYVECNLDAFPIDILIRWYQFHPSSLMGPGNLPLPFKTCRQADKTSYIYKNILQEHIGSISTFKERNVPGFRKEFEKCGAKTAGVWSSNEDEKFDIRRCNKWSVTPCSLPGPPF
jgi:hypothetical protein